MPELGELNFLSSWSRWTLKKVAALWLQEQKLFFPELTVGTPIERHELNIIT